MDVQNLYDRLPIALQHAVCCAKGASLERQRFGRGFRSALTAAEARSFATVDDAVAYRDARLRTFVRHCARSVPYYRRWFRENGIDPGDVRTLSDLSALPVLTKATVQRNAADFQSGDVPRRQLVAVHTSGTTGAGLRFSTTRAAVSEQYAIWWRYRGWHGLRRGTWCGHFGGRSVVPLVQQRPPFWRYDLAGRRVLFSGYHMRDEHLPLYVEEMRRRKLPWLHGYPSNLATLAAYIVDNGVDLPDCVRWITVGGENLLAQQAEAIQRAFGVRPIQHYGLAEAVANVSVCERGALHIDEDFAAVELLPLSDGTGYRIVGTNFSNPATPLLRYDTGDVATLDGAACDCGRPGRVVAYVDGRREDYVELANGALVGRMDHAFKDLTRIREAQIRQRRRGRLAVHVVRGDGYGDADEQELRRQMAMRLGGDTVVDIRYADRLPRGPSGKLRFVVSEIPEAKIDA